MTDGRDCRRQLLLNNDVRDFRPPDRPAGKSPLLCTRSFLIECRGAISYDTSPTRRPCFPPESSRLLVLSNSTSPNQHPTDKSSYLYFTGRNLSGFASHTVGLGSAVLMYPIGSSIQLDHRPSFSFLPSPINYVDRYSDHHIRQGSSSRRKIREQQFPRQHFETSQQPSQANHWNRPVTGLRTPPTEEEMGTTYQVPNMASYENKHVHHSAYASKTGHAERARGAMGDTIYDAATRYSTPQDYPLQPQYQQPQPHYQQQALPQGRSRASHSTTTSQPSRSRPPTRPATPSSATMSTKSQSDAVTAARDAGMVLHNLQIPTCISPNGGDLADFTAQVRCPDN